MKDAEQKALSGEKKKGTPCKCQALIRKKKSEKFVFLNPDTI